MQEGPKYTSSSAEKDPAVLEARGHTLSNVHSHTGFEASPRVVSEELVLQ